MTEPTVLSERLEVEVLWNRDGRKSWKFWAACGNDMDRAEHSMRHAMDCGAVNARIVRITRSALARARGEV